MRLYLTCALLVIAPTLTHAQDPGQAPDQPQGRAEARIARQTPKVIPKGRVIGHILCNDTRQPARGATVMLQQMPTKEQIATGQSQGQSLFGRVGLDGAYAIDRVPAGDYAVLAFLPGYLSPIDDAVMTDGEDLEKPMRDKLASAQLIHVAVQGTHTADLMLERGATVSGRVLYSDGAPASQVSIELEDTHAKPNPHPEAQALNMGAMYRSIFTHQTPSTDDQGRFRLAGIHPGTYRVAVLQPVSLTAAEGAGDDGMGAFMGLGIFGGGGDPRSARFYAGDTFHKKSAKTYDLRPGDTLADLDIRLPIDGFQDVRIHLASVDGRTINSASLALTDTSDDSIHFSNMSTGIRPMGEDEIGNSDGMYQFHSVPPGTYSLKVSGASILASHMGRPDTTNFPKGFDATKMPDIPIVTSTTIFSDSTTTVIIKDSAPSDLNLTLTEAPKSTLPNPPPP